MKQKINGLLKKYTNHNNIFLAQRGNKAILAALRLVKEVNPKKYILVPDQGGWLTYLQYPKKLKFEIRKLKTDYGIINLNFLKKNIENASALIYSNPAGYFAEQPLKEIYNECKKNNCLVILDASGSIGSEQCNGNYADIVIASFGKWKPVNLEYGGFISFNNNKFLVKNILNELQFNELKLDDLCKKLKNLKNRYAYFNKVNKKIKNDLKKFNIIHKNKNGINVIVKFINEKEKNEIISYCEKNKYQFLICPRYIRINENAISIEVKRL